jgi:hypothetical protein
VVPAEHPHPVGEQLSERGAGTGRILHLRAPPGEAVAGGEGVGVVRAEPLFGLGVQVAEVVDGGGGQSRLAEAAPGPEQGLSP